jgi:hypothetical protein
MEISTTFSVGGEYRVTKYLRGHEDAGPIEVTPWQPNTVLASGKELLLRRMIGQFTDTGTYTNYGAQPMDRRACLLLFDSGYNELRRISNYSPYGNYTAQAGGGFGARGYWYFRDDSTASYTPTIVRLRNWNSNGPYYDFSEAGVAWGTKPDYEIWDYEYRLTMTRGTGSNITDAGLDALMGILTDNHPVYGQGAARAWFDTSTVMQVTANAVDTTPDYSGADLLSCQDPANPSQVLVLNTTANPNSPTLTYRFYAPTYAGVYAWRYYRIGRYVPYIGDYIWLRDGSGPGYSKPNYQNWFWDWTFKVN